MRRVIWTATAFVLCGGEDSAQARLDALWPELQVLCEAALQPLKRYRDIEQNQSKSSAEGKLATRDNIWLSSCR